MRPIDGDALLAEAEVAPMYAVDAMVCYDLIKSAPTLTNFVPKKTGEWVYDPDDRFCYYCTNCGESAHRVGPNQDDLTKFCPECGAEMKIPEVRRTPYDFI